MFRRAWLCCMTLVLVPCCCSHGHSSWSYVSEAGRYLPPKCCLWLLWAVSLEPEAEHISLINGKDKECMLLWLHRTLCLHYSISALVVLVFILKLQECVECCCASMWSTQCQILKRGAVRWCEILKISLCCVSFVHSWVQGEGTHHHDLDQMWCLHEASDTPQK